MFSMESQPSIFAEVAQKSRAKRAQMNEKTVARAAKILKDGEDEHAERFIKFAADFGRPGLNAKGIVPNTQNPGHEAEEIEPVDGQDSVTFKAAYPSTLHLGESAEVRESLWENLRRMQESGIERTADEEDIRRTP